MAPKSCMLIGAWVGNWIWLRFVHLGILLFLKLFWMPGEGLNVGDVTMGLTCPQNQDV